MTTSPDVRDADAMAGWRSTASVWARRQSVPAAPLVAALLILVVAGVAGAVALGQRGVEVDAPVPDPVAWFVPVQIVSACVWCGVVLFTGQRRDLWWWKLAFVAGMSHAGAALAYTWAVRGLVVGADAPGATIAAALAGMLLPVEVPVLIYLATSLPSGALTRDRSDQWGWAATVMASTGVVVGAVSAPDADGTDFESARNPWSLGLGPSPLVPALIAGGALVGTVVVVVNWQRSTGADRQAMRWVAWMHIVSTIVIVPVVALTPGRVGVGIAQVAGALGLLAMVTVVRRQTMLGIERFFERTLRFALLAGCLAAVYAAVVALVSSVVDDGARPLAAAVVALAVLPLRDRLGRAVQHFVYGDRAEPTEVIGRIASAAESDLDPVGLLERVLDELRSGTGARAAWITLDGHGIASSIGTPPANTHGMFDVELVSRGSRIGMLTIAPADRETTVDPLAQRVASTVAPHVAVLADAYVKQAELTQARTRLISAREEERRRLRRDLHDGLGPILTGAAFSADAAANVVAHDPDRASALIGATRHDIRTAISEVRRIVENLRPPALDELGLAGAIRQLADRFPQLDITVTEPDRDLVLPAAIEVAAYRIATEALTNVARHSKASTADVVIRLDDELTVSITDNGPMCAEWSPGVGLTSMSDRAAEAGGLIDAGPRPAGGGRVVARFPAVAT